MGQKAPRLQPGDEWPSPLAGFLPRCENGSVDTCTLPIQSCFAGFQAKPLAWVKARALLERVPSAGVGLRMSDSSPDDGCHVQWGRAGPSYRKPLGCMACRDHPFRRLVRESPGFIRGSVKISLRFRSEPCPVGCCSGCGLVASVIVISPLVYGHHSVALWQGRVEEHQDDREQQIGAPHNPTTRAVASTPQSFFLYSMPVLARNASGSGRTTRPCRSRRPLSGVLCTPGLCRLRRSRRRRAR